MNNVNHKANRAARRRGEVPILQPPREVADARLERARAVLVHPMLLDSMLRLTASWAFEMTSLPENAQLLRHGLTPDGMILLLYWSPDWPVNLDPANPPVQQVSWVRYRVTASEPWETPEADGEAVVEEDGEEK